MHRTFCASWRVRVNGWTLAVLGLAEKVNLLIRQLYTLSFFETGIGWSSTYRSECLERAHHIPLIGSHAIHPSFRSFN
jgi:hypothetical protein